MLRKARPDEKRREDWVLCWRAVYVKDGHPISGWITHKPTVEEFIEKYNNATINPTQTEIEERMVDIAKGYHQP